MALDDTVSILRSAPIKAIISLNKSSSGASTPTRLSTAEVLRVLVPTALKAATGAGELSQWLRSAASLARVTPGYRIDIGWDLDAVARNIQIAIDMGKQASRSMKDALDVPVALMVFARPDSLAKILASVRTARPRLLFVVADGPRATHPQDIANCAAVRGVLDTVDWPCEIRRLESDRNMGCDPRIVSGLDWVFRQVDEAIVLEDDVIPDPSFFPWCAAMLRRYRHEPQIMHVAGRNELQRGAQATLTITWSEMGACGVGPHGRARGGRSTVPSRPIQPAPGPREANWRRWDWTPCSPSVLNFCLSAIETRPLRPWDTTWHLCRTIAGGICVVPPVNLMRQRRFWSGCDAHRARSRSERRVEDRPVRRCSGHRRKRTVRTRQQI